MLPWQGAVMLAALAIVVATAPMCRAVDARGRSSWRVAAVHDGDTVTAVDASGRRQRIRLVGIDAPELDQPMGRQARAALAARVEGRALAVEGTARDQHGRLLAILWAGDSNVNQSLVADGWAWAFTGFGDDDALVDLEATARHAHRGLWADPHPIAPSAWRERHPSQSSKPGAGSP